MKKTEHLWCAAKITMEQMKGVKPSSQPWQGRILIVEPHLHYISNYIRCLKKNQPFLVNLFKKIVFIVYNGNR